MSGDELGTAHEIDLSHGRLRYHERGEGPPVVFVHGIFVDARLWRGVVPGVAAAGFRCIAPDLPLGTHEIPMPDADLTPPAMARMIVEFLERMDLRDVTIVCSDTGAAYTQMVMADHPERIGRVVITPGDAFEQFFPLQFAYLPLVARIPGGTALMTASLRLRLVQRMPIAYGGIIKHPTDLVDGFVQRTKAPGIAEDLRRVLRDVNGRHTLAAVAGLRRFTGPVLLAWAIEDKAFPISQAHRLAEVLPNAEVVGIPDSFTLVPLDQPARLTELVVDFLRAHTAS